MGKLPEDICAVTLNGGKVISEPCDNGIRFYFDTGLRVRCVEMGNVKCFSSLDSQRVKDRLRELDKELQADEIVVNCCTAGEQFIVIKIVYDGDIITLSDNNDVEVLPAVVEVYDYEYYVLKNLHEDLFNLMEIGKRG